MRTLLRLALTLTLSALGALAVYLWIWRPELDALRLQLAGHELELLAPRWLILLSLLPWLWLAQGWSLVDMSRSQQALSLGVRLLLGAGLVLALCRPAITSYEQRISTVFVVDVSESISDDQLAAARQLVERAWQARGQNELRLVTFARSPRVVALDPQARRIPPLARHPGPLAGQASDPQAAIQQAYGLFSPRTLQRIVLISDGNETDGNLLAEGHRAASRSVRLSVQTLPDRAQQEVLVRALRLPEEVRVGAPFDLRAEIYSTHPEKVRLTLYKDEFINGLDGQKEVRLEPGKNQISFKSLVRQPGAVSYRLVLTGAAQDSWGQNNSASAVLPVFGKPRVLYIEGEPAYAGYLQRALEAEKIDVTVRGPHGLPASPAELNAFDLVILSDVSAIYIGLAQMAALKAYVQELGGGLIMAGGQNSFGAGGYYGTPLEKLLPVQFDTEKKRDQPSLALILALDRSGSMTGPKLELAKEAAKATTEILGSSDLIGVVAFDSAPNVLVRLQRASNRLRILNDIARLQAGGGTSIKPALQQALGQLAPATAKVKHVILLSDGQSGYSGIAQLVDEMVANKITVSAVGVGDGADRTLLQMIAERGNGRFYHTDDANNIPKIFTKETTEVARSSLVEERVRVRLLKQANVLGGIDWSAAPALRGYVSTKPKPLAETLLVSELGEPILAIWRQGLGKAAAFTSDVKNRWAVDWLRWPGYRQFWSQLAREVMRHRVQRSFAMRARADHGTIQVTVDALDRQDRFINGLASRLAVVDPFHPGRKQEVSLQQTAAGRYEASFRLQRYGAFLLRARHKAQGQLVAESITALAVPYPQEYTDLLQNKELLAQATAPSSGSVDPSPQALWDPGEEKIRAFEDLWPYFLYIILGLFLVDVLLRRVRLLGHAQQP